MGELHDCLYSNRTYTRRNKEQQQQKEQVHKLAQQQKEQEQDAGQKKTFEQEQKEAAVTSPPGRKVAEVQAVAFTRFSLARDFIVPPRFVDDILRCGVYGTFAMANHEESVANMFRYTSGPV
jgi:hypothetical protein